jgi:hypothetical protein
MTHARFIPVALAILLVATVAFAQPKPAAVPTARALVISTELVEKDGPYARNMNDWTARFVALLTGKLGLPAGNIRVLAAKADARPARVTEVAEVAKGGEVATSSTSSTSSTFSSTLANVRSAFAALGKELRPEDQFVLILIGYGAVTDPVAKLCLAGEDLKATTLADLLDALPTRKVVILNFAGGGAEFLEKYARPGRVVVTACGKTRQGGQSYLAEFFLAAYESRRDGTITVLEAFNESARRCINWYHRQYKIPPPKDLPEDAPPPKRQVEVRTAEARRLFQKFYAGIPDLEMVVSEINEDDDVDPKADGIEDLPLRREAGEHASIEDRGDADEAVLHWSQSKHRVLTGKPDEEGALAARTVLGSPKLLPPAE